MSNVTELLLYLYAESPVHAGGAESIGALDLPVQREATTGYPVIWGQSLKGALRQAATDAQWSKEDVEAVFGSSIDEGGEAGEAAAGRQLRAGTLAVGDAQLIAMPVPTLRRTFAWATSDIALARLRRKYAVLPEQLRTGVPPVPEIATDAGAAPAELWIGDPTPPPQGEALGPCLVPLGTAPEPRLKDWAARVATDALGDQDLFGQMAAKLRTDLLLVGTDIMPTLVRECTEFVSRVQLGDGKTVKQGPFYSEYLPAETLMAVSLSLRADRSDTDGSAQRTQHRRLTELMHGSLVQVGGDQTIGKGLMWANLVGGAS